MGQRRRPLPQFSTRGCAPGGSRLVFDGLNFTAFGADKNVVFAQWQILLRLLDCTDLNRALFGIHVQCDRASDLTAERSFATNIDVCSGHAYTTRTWQRYMTSVYHDM